MRDKISFEFRVLVSLFYVISVNLKFSREHSRILIMLYRYILWFYA